jgi:hypothetical protein
MQPSLFPLQEQIEILILLEIVSGGNTLSGMSQMLSTISNVSSLHYTFHHTLTRRSDDSELVHGMPICVQIVGGRFGEEKAVAVGKVIDGLMNPTPFHSHDK